MAKSATLAIKIITDARGAQAGLAKTEGALGRVGKIGKVAGVAVAAGLAAAAAGAVAFGISAVKAASDMNETVSKTQQVFGTASGAVTKFAATAATKFGISQQSALDAAATFGVFGKSAGKSGKDLAGFSTGLVGTAADMASFANTTPEDAITALSAALRGEAEPIRKYGILLDDATLRQEAVRQGIVKTTKTALTPQQKVLASHAVIMRQLGDQQGDFTRTSAGMANQQRIVSAQFANLKATIGQALLPVALTLLHLLTALMPALMAAGNALKTALGPGVAQATGFLQRLNPVLQGLAAQFMALLPSLLATARTIAGTLIPVAAGLAKLLVTNVAPVLLTVGRILLAQVVPPLLKLAAVIAKNALPILLSIARVILTFVIPVVRIVGSVVAVLAKVIAGALGPALRIIAPLFAKLQAIVQKNQGTLNQIATVVGIVARVLGVVLGAALKVTLIPALKILVFVLGGVLDVFGFLLSMLGKVIGKIIEMVDWLKKIKVPKINLPNIPGIGGKSAAAFTTAATASPGLRAAAPTATTGQAVGMGGVVINIYGVLDGADAARKIRGVLRDDDRRRSGVQVTRAGGRSWQPA